MRYTVLINQKRCLDFNLNISEAVLLQLCNELSSWADEKHLDKQTYYHLSRNKVISELPFFFNKADTVYRVFKSLVEKGFIEHKKEGRKDFVRLTNEGKYWNKLGNKSELEQNSEINPSKLGNKSELGDRGLCPINTTNELQNSEINPTNKNIKIPEDKRGARAWDFLIKENPIEMESFIMQHNKQLRNWEDFILHFNDTADKEDLDFKVRVLMGRLRILFRNWQRIEHKSEGLKVIRIPGETLATNPAYKKAQL